MKIDIILLAAGNSSRFQGNKLLYCYKQKPLFEYTINHIKELISIPESIIGTVVLVTKYSEIIQAVQKISRIVPVINKNSELGISYSIYLGIYQVLKLQRPEDFLWNIKKKEWFLKNSLNHSLVDKETAYCFMVCDQPELKFNTLKNFLNSYPISKKGISCLSFHGILGNPVIFSSNYLEELLSLTGDIGGKKIVKRHMEDVFCYEAELEKELVDFDYKPI